MRGGARLGNRPSLWPRRRQSARPIADGSDVPGEVLASSFTDTLLPGSADTLAAVLTLDDGNYLLAASVSLAGDQVPGNDRMLTGLVCGGGTFPAVSEVLCNPISQDTDEFIDAMITCVEDMGGDEPPVGVCADTAADFADTCL